MLTRRTKSKDQALETIQYQKNQHRAPPESRHSPTTLRLTEADDNISLAIRRMWSHRHHGGANAHPERTSNG